MTAQAYSASELGEVQLNAAIDLYLTDNFIPAITLAGAAEEQYGGSHAKPHIEWETDPRAHKEDARAFNNVHTALFGDGHEKPWDAVNAVKNTTKHYSRELLVMDAEDEAYWAIDRALRNRMLDVGGEHPQRVMVDAAHVRHQTASEHSETQPYQPD